MKKTSQDNIIPTKDGDKLDRNALKQRGFFRFLKSFGYSIDGLKYAYKNEQSMLIHILVTIAVITLNVVLTIFDKIGKEVWWISLIVIGMVLAAELINTAIEAVVDMVTTEYNPLAKVAKDCGSAATFVLAVMAFAIGVVVYGPILLEIVGLK